MAKGIEYKAAIAIPPGETLKEFLDNEGMSQIELSKRIGLSEKHISEIINGKSPITHDTAIKLECVLKSPASFWINLEANYQETKARVKAEQELNDELAITRDIPYAEIAKLNWVNATIKADEKVMNLRSFFKVASLNYVPKVMTAAFRKSEVGKASNYALAVWLRRGEIVSEKVITQPYSKPRLKKLIPRFRQLTLENPEDFFPEMVNLCASCGIALVLVPHISKTYVCGATQWKGDKAIIQLSVRGARADIFWFTFFHEIAHILLHDKKEFHLHGEDESCKGEEEANLEAGVMLIPANEYKDFIKDCDYTNKSEIKMFAKDIGIDPCIVVGRLLHEEKIDYRCYSDLRPSFKIVED